MLFLNMFDKNNWLLFQSNWDEVVDNFDDMKLKEELLRGIYAYGFEKPSAIQQRAIIPCIKGKREKKLGQIDIWKKLGMFRAEHI